MKNHTISPKKSKKKQLVEQTTIGIDLGDQWSHYCVLDEVGEITEEADFEPRRKP
jgi:transposase